MIKDLIKEVLDKFESLHSERPNFSVTSGVYLKVRNTLIHNGIRLFEYKWDDGYLIQRNIGGEVTWIECQYPMVSNFYTKLLGDPIPDYMSVRLVDDTIEFYWDSEKFNKRFESIFESEYFEGVKFGVPVENAKEFFKNFKRCYELASRVTVII